MDEEEFRRYGVEMIDYIIKYEQSLRNRSVNTNVEPGYLKKLIPDQAPRERENFSTIMADFNRFIMPGLLHWNHPRFFAYFPTIGSPACSLADFLISSMNIIQLTWVSSPAATELEIVMMDWMAKMIDLPDFFLSNSQGGGVIQSSASESTFIALHSARTKTLNNLKQKFPDIDDVRVMMPKLIAYCSEEAHSSVEKAGILGCVTTRKLKTDDKFALRGATLNDAIRDDIGKGNIPFFVCGTLGTTSFCSFDNIEEIGEICKKYDLWFHIDAAYAGSAFICPEFRQYMKGIERVTSFVFSPHKWLFVSCGCTAMFVKNKHDVINAMRVNPVYLSHERGEDVTDFKDWQIPLGRNFRSLKIWFVLRSYGIDKLQEHIRNHVRLAHEFEDLIRASNQFELTAEVVMGLVCFRVKESNEVNERLLRLINREGRIHITPCEGKGVFSMRLAVCRPEVTSDDIQFAFKVICENYHRLTNTHKTMITNGNV